MPDDQYGPAGAASAKAALAVSVVNGFFGDYLRDRQNGLAIEMAFYHRNRPLPLTHEAILRVHPHPTGKLCVLVHGLGCNESIWTFADPAQPAQATSYGELLQAEHGYAPLYLRYNSGLPIGANGKRLAILLDDLLAAYPVPADDIVLIGHSMGGLVLRSACHYGALQGSAWVQRVTRVFYLGTPHDGANLEKLAHATTLALQAVPNPVTRIVGRFLHRRSQGVKDLRFGTLLEPDTADEVPQSPQQSAQPPVPWLEPAEHYLIGGMLTDQPDQVTTALLGDGLVLVPRPLDQRGQATGESPAPAGSVEIFPRTHHLKLTRDWEVYRQISAWCQSPEEE